MQYRVGIVGTGGIAHRHLSGYRAVLVDRCQVTAACDLRPDVLDEFCKRYGIPHQFNSAEEMIASGEIDIVVALTPPAIRDEIIDPALEHGVHMLIEKPFGENAKRAVGYVNAAREADVRIAVNQNLRFFPEVLATRECLREGTVGGVRFINHDHFQNRPQKTGWRAYEERLEMAIFSVHIIDRIQWLVGKNPVAVSAVTRKGLDDIPKGEQFASLLIQFEDGVVGTMTSNWFSKALSESRLRVDGEIGSISASRPVALWGDAIWSCAVEGQDARTRYFRDQNDFDKCFGYSLGSIMNALDEGQEPVSSGRDNLKTMGIMDAAYISAARGGELVTVEEALGVSLTSMRDSA